MLQHTAPPTLIAISATSPVSRCGKWREGRRSGSVRHVVSVLLGRKPPAARRLRLERVAGSAEPLLKRERGDGPSACRWGRCSPRSEGTLLWAIYISLSPGSMFAAAAGLSVLGLILAPFSGQKHFRPKLWSQEHFLVVLEDSFGCWSFALSCLCCSTQLLPSASKMEPSASPGCGLEPPLSTHQTGSGQSEPENGREETFFIVHGS